ncbi:MAG: spore coat associated protein CotJA [Clostridium sp.]
MNNEINCSHRKMEYACAFILPQTYENLFLVKDALFRGTIFKDLYKPYDEKKHSRWE